MVLSPTQPFSTVSHRVLPRQRLAPPPTMTAPVLLPAGTPVHYPHQGQLLVNNHDESCIYFSLFFFAVGIHVGHVDVKIVATL